MNNLINSLKQKYDRKERINEIFNSAIMDANLIHEKINEKIKEIQKKNGEIPINYRKFQKKRKDFMKNIKHNFQNILFLKKKMYQIKKENLILLNKKYFYRKK